MSVLDLIKGGTAFQNPFQETFGTVPTTLRQFSSAIGIGSPTFLLYGQVIDLSALNPLTNPTENASFVTQISALADSYDGMLQHVDAQVSPIQTPGSSTPSIIQMLSANDGFGADEACMVAQTVMGVIQNKDQIILEWNSFLQQIQNWINSLSSQNIDALQQNIAAQVDQDLVAFTNTVVAIAQNAAAKVVEAAFGNKCAQLMLDMIATPQLKAEQELLQKARGRL